MARKPILIPGGQEEALQTFIEAQADVLVHLVGQAELLSGRQLETPYKDGRPAYKVTKVNPDLVYSALDHLQPLTEVIIYTTLKITAEANAMYLGEFCQLIEAGHFILEQVASGEHYTLEDDLDELLLNIRVQKLIDGIKSKPKPKSDIAELLLSDDPAFRHSQTDKSIPYRVYKHILEKRIPGNDASFGICREFSRKWEGIKERMEHARQTQVGWELLFKEEDTLIDNWKTALNLTR